MTDRDPPNPLTDAFLDRIVDGELSPAELRAALEQLENEPDGWKRCALAFLEAQYWRESFRMADEHGPLSKERLGPRGEWRPSRPGRLWSTGRRFALAAGIAALAFVLGWHARPDRAAKVPVADAPPTLEIVNRPEPLMTSTTVDRPAPDSESVGPTPDGLRSSDPIPPIITVGQLRIGPTDSPAVVPILAGAGIDEQWVRNQPPPITEHQQAMLEQQGYRIDRRRRLITARLADGRRVAVPVDQVQVLYTGIEPL
jgi:hypothetical protein